MNLYISAAWMFIGSIIIGVFFNGMNFLAYRFDDLYVSTTLVYVALLMASNMVLLEVLMFSWMEKRLNIPLFTVFILFSVLIVFLMRKQVFVNDKEWLRRMIPHHSTAITTSKHILQTTKDEKIRKLAQNIVKTQLEEIAYMKELLKKPTFS